MNLRSLLGLASALLLASAPLALAEDHSYSMSGTITAIDGSNVTIQGGGKTKEKSTFTLGSGVAKTWKVGDVVKIDYFMTATAIGTKDTAAPKKAPSAAKKAKAAGAATEAPQSTPPTKKQ